MPYVRTFAADLAAHRRAWADDPTDLKGIGPAMVAQMRQISGEDFDTVDEVATWIDQQAAAHPNGREVGAREAVASLFPNPRRGTCVGNPGRVQVLASWFNREAFNAIADMFGVAVVSPHVNIVAANYPGDIAQRLICWNEGLMVRQAAAGPGESACIQGANRLGSGGFASRPEAFCPCRPDQAQCEVEDPAAGPCRWVATQGGGCLPRFPQYDQGRARPDFGGYAGDWLAGAAAPAQVRSDGHGNPLGKYVQIPGGGGWAYVPGAAVDDGDGDDSDETASMPSVHDDDDDDDETASVGSVNLLAGSYSTDEDRRSPSPEPRRSRRVSGRRSSSADSRRSGSAGGSRRSGPATTRRRSGRSRTPAGRSRSRSRSPSPYRGGYGGGYEDDWDDGGYAQRWDDDDESVPGSRASPVESWDAGEYADSDVSGPSRPAPASSSRSTDFLVRSDTSSASRNTDFLVRSDTSSGS